MKLLIECPRVEKLLRLKAFGLLMLLTGLSACNISSWMGAAPQVSPKELGAPSTANLATPSARLGIVGEETITQSDLDRATQEELDDINNQWAQKKLHLLWAGFEDAVNHRLIAQKARSEGLSPELLIERDVIQKVTAPTQAEMKEFYKNNSQVIGAQYEIAEPHIKRELVKQRRNEIEMAFLADLRSRTSIVYDLPMPELPRKSIPPAPAPFTGPKNAKVTLVEFGDFECPYCSQAHRVVQQLRELYPADLRVEYRHFPLEQHVRARPAAVASQCAHEQGMFWQYHDFLYQNQRGLTDQNLLSYAKTLKLNMKQFGACIQSEKANAAIRRDEKTARKLGVDGTPSIYINGIKLIGLLPLPLIRVIIDHELKQHAGRG